MQEEGEGVVMDEYGMKKGKKRKANANAKKAHNPQERKPRRNWIGGPKWFEGQKPSIERNLPHLCDLHTSL